VDTIEVRYDERSDAACSEHLATPFDHVALRDVLGALDPAHSQAPSCEIVLPVVGG
jgi:hypothetical protein